MSDLSSIEKLKLEKLFEMGGGYVLDFSNRTFQQFILDNAGVDIYDDKYDYASGSKANRLRAFWSKESNFAVGKLVSDLLEYWRALKAIRDSDTTEAEQELYDECLGISERLTQGNPAEHVDAIQPYSDERDVSLLVRTIRESIQKDQPEVALDRLHTFVVKYVRWLCDKHGIAYDRNRPLHSLFGGYVKHLKRNNIIESEMTERILKSSISILESFNKVRNEQSFAHDNPLLNYHESLLIFNSVASAIRFIESVEKKPDSEPDELEWEIPF